jgi:hypothetical protein
MPLHQVAQHQQRPAPLLGRHVRAQGLLEMAVRLLVISEHHIQLRQAHECLSPEGAIAGDADDGGVVALEPVTFDDGLDGGGMPALGALPESIRIEVSRGRCCTALDDGEDQSRPCGPDNDCVCRVHDWRWLAARSGPTLSSNHSRS